MGGREGVEYHVHSVSGYDVYLDYELSNLHRMAPIYWPNTNRMVLSVQHASEIERLLKRNVTPALEHLSVTIELMDLVINKYGRYQSKRTVQTQFLQLFIAACEERGYDGTTIDLRFYRNDEISVWL